MASILSNNNELFYPHYSRCASDYATLIKPKSNVNPTDAELTISLTPEEAKALAKALGEITFNTGAPQLKLWRGIQAKLKDAPVELSDA